MPDPVVEPKTGVDDAGVADQQQAAAPAAAQDPAAPVAADPQQPVPGQPESAPAPAADAQQGQEATIQAERERRQEAEAKLATTEQQLALAQIVAQQQAAQQPAAQPAAPVDPYAGLEDYDTITVAQAKQQRTDFDTKMRTMQANTNDALFMASRPDYADVVGKIDPFTGQFVASEHLQKVLTKAPELAMRLQSDPQGAKALAYQLASSEKQLADAVTPVDPKVRDAAIANLVSAQTAPMPAASASGGGAVTPDAGLRAMTDAEFNAEEARVLSGEYG